VGVRLLRIGGYLYYFDGIWVDLDERKRPKTPLKLFGWATPEGWRQGLRPRLVAGAHSDGRDCASVDPGSSQNQQLVHGDVGELVRQIEGLEKPLGKSLYRGLLKRVARVWRPGQIQDVLLLRKLFPICKELSEDCDDWRPQSGLTDPRL